MEPPVAASEEIVPAFKSMATTTTSLKPTTTSTTSTLSTTTTTTPALSTTTTTSASSLVTASDPKVSQGNAISSSAVKVVETKNVTPKSDDATSMSASAKDDHDRTKLSLKLPPRPEDYDYYWYQDDDGTWRNEYDDQVKLKLFLILYFPKTLYEFFLKVIFCWDIFGYLFYFLFLILIEVTSFAYIPSSI